MAGSQEQVTDFIVSKRPINGMALFHEGRYTSPAGRPKPPGRGRGLVSEVARHWLSGL